MSETLQNLGLEPDADGMAPIHTTVDMLIERLNDYPEEFFNEATLPLLDATKCLDGTKWRRLTSHLCNPTTTGMFTLEEKQRFAHALDVKMREAMDVRIVKSLVTGESFDKSGEPLMRAPVMRAPGEWRDAGQVGKSANAATAQNIAQNAFDNEMAREKLKWEQEKAAGMLNAGMQNASMDRYLAPYRDAPRGSSVLGSIRKIWNDK